MTMTLHPEAYWAQVGGFWQRALSSLTLREFLLSGWWRSGVVLVAGLGVGVAIGTLVGVTSSFAVGGRGRPVLLSSTFLTMALPDFIVVLVAQRLVVYLYREFDFKLFPILSDMHPRGWC